MATPTRGGRTHRNSDTADDACYKSVVFEGGGLMLRLFAVASAALCLLGGCQTITRSPFTYTELAAASPDLRMDFIGDADEARFRADLAGAESAVRDGAFDLLALSGGGSDGAYGAGLLVGWSERGDRPVFEVVTGVSTGALMAPFAFIGQSGDEELTQAFTDGRSDGLLEARWAMAVSGPGLFRQRPLRALIASSITPEVLTRVAEGHRQGRRLYVATTSLDTQGQVVWDMGAVAQTGSRDLFISILTASASIPGIFPPVFIDVQRDDRTVRELHVDGRTTSNFFVMPERMMLDEGLFDGAGPSTPRRMWIAINGRPESRFSVARVSGLGVAGRGLDTMMKAATRMNLVATAQFARLNDFQLSVSMAPLGAGENSLGFSRARMASLFAEGRAAQRRGSAWASLEDDQTPPHVP